MEVVFVSADNQYVSGGLSKSNYLNRVKVIISNNKFTTLPNDAKSFTLEANNANWKFSCGDGTYLRQTGLDSNNTLEISSTDSNNVWSIKKGTNTAMIIQNIETGTSNYLKYSSGNSRFSNYKSSSNMADFQLYAHVGESVTL